MFGAGIGAGIAIGIAIGISSGSKQARDKISQYLQIQGFTICDQQGKPVAVDETFDEAFSCGDAAGRKFAVVMLMLGLLVAACAGVAIYFMVARG